MKHLLHLYLFALFALSVLALIACGEDEPMPVGPSEPEEQDTIPADTVQEDTTEADTAAVSKFEWFLHPNEYEAEKRIVQSAVCNIEDFTYIIDHLLDEKFYYKITLPSTMQFPDPIAVCEGKEFRLTIVSEGYQSQTVVSKGLWWRVMSFDMEPCSSTGISAGEANRASAPIRIANDEANRASSRLTATATMHGGGISNAEDGDTLSLVAFLPSTASVGYVGPGLDLRGAVAGVAVTPIGGQFDGDMEVELTLPQSVADYLLTVESSEGHEETTCSTKGDKVSFFAPYGAEWTVMAEAHVKEMTTEKICIASQKPCTSSDDHRIFIPVTPLVTLGYYAAFPIEYPYTGYEAESALNFVEEHFLTSIFGIKTQHFPDKFEIAGNRPFSIVYNVWQDVHHLTFEAAGRQFRAKVYGKAEIEIVSAAEKTLKS